MSGIAGIYNIDGAPVDRALLRRMTDAIAHRGPDGIHHWVDGPVGMGHCMLQTTPESVYERQPLTDESGNLCLTMDGRVDNREELISALKSKGARLRDDTDAELVLQAYECWGTECPARIIGDFSFVIWDKRQRQLFCVRDAVGNKPFVYFWDGRKFLWASELHQLLEDPTVPREPNEGMIGEYLADDITHTEETLYTGILRLAPAHSLIVESGRIKKHKYWDIDFGKQIRYGSDDEYAEHFRGVFKEAVRCRMRSFGPVGAHLSGGLDSSSVVCMVQTVFGEGLMEDRGFETFSMIFPGLPCDEQNYIQAVVDRWKLSANYLRQEDRAAGWLEQQVRFYQDICDYPNGMITDAIRSLVQQKGFRVLLTGLGGDQCLTGVLYYLSEFVRDGRFLSLFRELREQSFPPMSRGGLFDLLRYVLVPLLPTSARQVMRKRWRATRWKPRWLGWITPEFAHRVNLAERLQPSAGAPKNLNPSQAALYELLTHGSQYHVIEMDERAASRFCHEQRHPFRDRRMIELSFALPERQRLRKDQKFILRHAMRGLLPDVVRTRRDKAEFSDVMATALHSAGGQRLFKDFCVESSTWVDGNRVRMMYEEMKQLHGSRDERYIHYVWPLWMVYTIELWSKTLFSSGDTLGSSARREANTTDTDYHFAALSK